MLMVSSLIAAAMYCPSFDHATSFTSVPAFADRRLMCVVTFQTRTNPSSDAVTIISPSGEKSTPKYSLLDVVVNSFWKFGFPIAHPSLKSDVPSPSLSGQPSRSVVEVP